MLALRISMFLAEVSCSEKDKLVLKKVHELEEIDHHAIITTFDEISGYD